MIADDVNELAKRSGDNVSRPSAAGMPQRSLHGPYSRRACDAQSVVDRAVCHGLALKACYFRRSAGGFVPPQFYWRPPRCLGWNSKMYGGASLADTYRSLLVRRCAQAKPAERHTSYMRFKNTCNWHKPTIQMNTQNGRRITKADPLRQGCRRGAYRDCIHGVSAV